MTKIEQLVPPFELCQQIPTDAFNDTALVWKTYHRGIISDNPYVAERGTWDHEFREDFAQPIIPAPPLCLRHTAWGLSAERGNCVVSCY